MADAVLMAEILRGGMIESRHLGHAVAVRPDGEIIAKWGDPETVIYPRSSAKMIQALPLLESGAGRDLSQERRALACASHSAERRHVEAVRRWLGEIGCEEGDLACGPQESRDIELRNEMIREGTPVTRVFNNCSGKHTGFLMLAKHLKAGPDYVDPEHPVQVAVRAAFEEMIGEDSSGFGIDGCSAPNFATSLKGLGRAMARFAAAGRKSDARDKAAAALRDAMIAHPELVSGKGRACAEIMAAADGRAAVKTGAEGVFVAILPRLQIGVALKIADGATRASELALVGILVKLGVLETGHPVVARYLERPIQNWDGLVTGFERPASALLSES